MRPERAKAITSVLLITGIFGTSTSRSSAHKLCKTSASPCSWASFHTFSSLFRSCLSCSLDDWADTCFAAANTERANMTVMPSERNLTEAPPNRTPRAYHSRRLTIDPVSTHLLSKKANQKRTLVRTPGFDKVLADSEKA